MPELLTAGEAASRLGVQVATLYAYVSRGLLHSQPGQGRRDRRYLASEVEALVARRESRRDPRKAIAAALDFGAPVRESALTLINGGRFYYRGVDATRLARGGRVEQVASLLWGVDVEETVDLFAERARLPTGWRQFERRLASSPVAERFPIVLRLAKLGDPAAADLRPQRIARCGARILALLYEVAARRESGPAGDRGGKKQTPEAPDLVARLARAWAGKQKRARAALETTLILCADHELNVSSFTARCVASAGATPYDVVAGGLAALSGHRHGGHADRVEALFRELGLGTDRGEEVDAAAVRSRLSARLERGERIPGFGHPLYPDGDPRFPVVLERLREGWPGSSLVAAVETIVDEVGRLVDLAPTIDVGLAALSLQLELGAGGARTIFALGRTVGWIAHAIEETERGRLIRPRARYVGPVPESEPQA